MHIFTQRNLQGERKRRSYWFTQLKSFSFSLHFLCLIYAFLFLLFLFNPLINYLIIIAFIFTLFFLWKWSISALALKQELINLEELAKIAESNKTGLHIIFQKLNQQINKQAKMINSAIDVVSGRSKCDGKEVMEEVHWSERGWIKNQITASVSLFNIRTSYYNLTQFWKLKDFLKSILE